MYMKNSGRGYFILTIVIGIFALGIWLIPNDYIKIGGPLLFLIAGITLWGIGLLYNQERLVYDEKKDTYFKEKNTHTILLLPMQYWGLVFFFFGIGTVSQKDLIHAVIYTIIVVLLLIACFFLINKKAENDYYMTKNK